MKKTSFQNSTSRKYAPVAQEINNTDKVIVGLVSKSAQDGFTSKRILPEYGHLILQSSKVILLQAIYFICSHLCPTKCQLLYCDTDSIHLALAEKTLRYRRPGSFRHWFKNCIYLRECVPPHLQSEWDRQYPKYFGQHNLSGQLSKSIATLCVFNRILIIFFCCSFGVFGINSCLCRREDL